MSPETNGDTFGDADWFLLTEGMEPYERFRYIVRHVLEAAIDDAREYAVDERIFEELGDEELEAHLDRLDERLQEDDELSEVEARFMCAAVDAGLQEVGRRSTCYPELFDAAEPADLTRRDRS